MPGKRNPDKLVEVVHKLPRRRQRPDPFNSDDDLRVALTIWQGGMKLGADLQEMINFRLAELLAEKRKPLSPLQQALKDVARLTSGGAGFGSSLSETRACEEVARIRKLDAGTLLRSWRRKKKPPAKPRTKPP
jgi:hypothetical protein